MRALRPGEAVAGSVAATGAVVLVEAVGAEAAEDGVVQAMAAAGVAEAADLVVADLADAEVVSVEEDSGTKTSRPFFCCCGHPVREHPAGLG